MDDDMRDEDELEEDTLDLPDDEDDGILPDEEEDEEETLDRFGMHAEDEEESF